MGFLLTTDTMSDLPESYLREHSIERLSLTYLLDGVQYDIHNSLPSKVFYEKMRQGSTPTTSQFNPDYAEAAFRELLQKYDQDILHVSFSSGLSGSFSSAQVAARALAAEFPHRRIVVVDSLCASMGQGLIIYKAMRLKDSGASLDEVRDWLEANKLHLCHIFTVDDLVYLFRGGRVSRVAAWVGGILNIKPILHVDNEGHLVPFAKVRGRKRALAGLADAMEHQMGGYRESNDIVFISHGDCEDDAKIVADLIRERFGINSFIIGDIGPTIGAHSGPGTVALFFLGECR